MYVGPLSEEESPTSVEKHSIEYDRSCYSGPTFYPQKRLDKLKSAEQRMDKKDSLDTGVKATHYLAKKLVGIKSKNVRVAITKLRDRAASGLGRI